MVDIAIEVVECARCGVLMNLSSAYVKNRRADHEGFDCPNGHSNVFNDKSPVEELLAQERRVSAANLASYDRQRALSLRLEKRLAALKKKCPPTPKEPKVA